MKYEELAPLVEKGLSQREIGIALGRSQTNISSWISRYGLKTNGKAKHTGKGRYIQSTCIHHGETEFIWIPSGNRYKCKKCRSKRVNEDRRKLKREGVELLGSKCRGCGYSKSIWSMHFHHIDPSLKKYDLGQLIRDRKRSLFFEEIKLCKLLCANCHGETEEEAWVS